MGYKYGSYDDWKTENPWDGQARMEGKPFYREPPEDETEEDDDYHDTEDDF